MAIRTLRDLFISELKDAYDAEHRMTKALPKLIKAASSEALVAALEAHLEQTEEHIERLDEVFSMFDVSPARKTCKAMLGLLAEGEELMHEHGVEGMRDAALIAAAQKVEHYEMATYGCLRTWAQVMGEKKAQELLQLTLNEEGAADEALTVIALTLNAEALDEGDDEEEALVPSTRESNVTHRPVKNTRSR